MKISNLFRLLKFALGYYSLNIVYPYIEFLSKEYSVTGGLSSDVIQTGTVSLKLNGQ